ncbi:hypothetical protein L1887_50579 [Cichorium endivia]|nr:hypothetical protein L1887_50579 [Cichorium endivia]
MSPLEPYQSDAFREMRKRVHSLSTPPTASPPRTHKQPSLPPSGTTSSVFVPDSAQIQSLKSPSPSPSPPLSEASPRSCPPSSSQTPLTQASDSSASSFDDIHMHQHRRSSRRATHKAHAWSGTHRRLTGPRSNLAQKRVYSEDDISSHRLAKWNRSQVSPVHSKRRLSTGPSTSASLPLTSPSSLPSVALSWRRALKRQRKRHSDTAQAVRKARASSRTQTPGPNTQDRASAAAESVPRLDVLPELRLLSATRTAPIGWTRMASISNPLAHTLEMYDESNAKRAPERQRFWPIVDHQLDYTGARMLSLSSASNGRLQLGNHFTKAAISLPIDEPVSPKSGVAPASCPLTRCLCSPGIASSDEDRSPLTPGACVKPPRASTTVSR